MFVGVGHRAVAIALGIVGAAVVALAVWTREAADHEWSVFEFEGASASSAALPSEASWRPLRLPERHCDVSPTPCFDHYRFRFEYDAEPVGIFVAHVIGSLSVRVNGVEIFQIGSMSDPEAIFFHPAYVRVPDQLLDQGVNELHLVLTNIPGRYHRLRGLLIGDHAALRTFSRPLIWLVNDVARYSTGLFFAGLAFGLLMFFTARMNAVYLWFVLLCLASITRNMFFEMSDPQLEELRQALYLYGSNLSLSITLVLVALFVPAQWPLWRLSRWQNALALNVGVATLVSALLLLGRYQPYAAEQLGSLFTAGFSILMGVLILVGSFRYYFARKTVVSAWVLALIVGSYALTLNDASFILQGQTGLYPLAHIAPILLVTACLVFSVGEYRSLQQALGAAQRDRERSLIGLRQSIRRDLHDSLSGSIVSTLMLARRRAPEIAPLLEQSLNQLRMLLEHLDNDESSSANIALQALQPSVSDLLFRHQLDVDWQGEFPEDRHLSPEVRRALFFATQEVVHNVVRHAEASSVLFQASQKDGELLLSVKDDGIGFSNVSDHASGGLAGIRTRLTQLGGWLDVKSDRNGTEVIFAVPVQ